MITAAVVGGTGYTGIELIRILLGHPQFSLVAATSTKDAGTPLAKLYPALLGQTDLVYTSYDARALTQAAQVIFLAVPHTKALELAPELLEAGCIVIDLSADYRLDDPSVYEAWYKTTHTSPDLLEHAAYGLPEYYREDIAAAKLIACPGCYPTATSLGAAPAFEAGVVADNSCVVTALSGVSGAGKTPSATTHFCSANESVNAYGAFTHRHTPEITQVLSSVAGYSVDVSFVPHLVPMTRGLLSTVHMRLCKGSSAELLYGIYRKRYAKEPFVELLPPGELPATRDVRGSNRAQVGCVVDEKGSQAIVSVAIDNLMKGASSQAVQCANIVCGLAETEGLSLFGPIV